MIKDSTIYACTQTRGIWKADINTITSVSGHESPFIPERFYLSQNYPNPFNPTTDFEFRIADFGFVTLKVYDIQGKEIETLVNGNLKAGIYSITFDGGGLQSGVYFYRLEAGDFTETKKMLLVK